MITQSTKNKQIHLTSNTFYYIASSIDTIWLIPAVIGRLYYPIKRSDLVPHPNNDLDPFSIRKGMRVKVDDGRFGVGK